MNLNENMKYITPIGVQPLINKFCLTIGMIPSSYKLALTYEEQLLCIGKFIDETVIPALNNNAEAVTELQILFSDLKNYVENYFDDINIQNEINNKLDEMYENGDFENILNNYLNITKVFNTTSDLLESEETFVNGQKIKTLGYYNINDGGGADFVVSDTEDLTIFQIDLGSLYLNIIQEDNSQINVRKLGVKDDNDNLSLLQAINDKYSNITIYIPKGNFGLSNTLYISNENNLLMDNECTLYATAIMDYLVCYNKDNTQATTFYKFIRGGKLDGKNLVSEAILTMQYYSILYVEDLKIYNFAKYGMKTRKQDNQQGNGVFGNNLYFRNDTPQSNSLAIYSNGKDGKYSNIVMRDCVGGVICYDGLWTKIHHWIGFQSLLENSFTFKTLDRYAIIDDCYIDTIRYPFISTYGVQMVSNSMVIYNTGVYTTANFENYPPTIFKAEQDTYGLNSWGVYNATNIIIINQKKGAIVSRNNNYNNFENIKMTGVPNDVDRKYMTRVNNNTIGTNYYSGDLNDIHYTTTKYCNYGADKHFPGSSSGYLITYAMGIDDFAGVDKSNTVDARNILQIFINSNHSHLFIRSYTYSNETWSNWSDFY